MSAYSVIAVIPSLSPIAGGPSVSVPQLIMALASSGVGQDLVTVAYSGERRRFQVPEGNPLRLHLVPGFSSRVMRVTWCHGMYSYLRGLARDAAVKVVHNHGIWTMVNHAAAKLARERQLPLVQTPHGMLSSWSLKHRSLKKRVAMRLYQRRDLEAVCVFHATSHSEAQDIRSLGFRAKIAVVPNGIVIPPRIARGRSNLGMKTILFIGRIYPVKGLPNLLKAWSAVRRDGWRIQIVGPDEDGHLAELRQLCADAAIDDSVLFHGEVGENEKWKFYANSDVFVLPSYSENFGLVVGEAMASGIPVIATQGTPWKVLSDSGSGWWIATGVEPLAAALREAMDASDQQRSRMGEIGRAIIERDYSWAEVATKMSAVYEYALGNCDLPSSVCWHN